jgi:hypothetical protein
MVGLLAIGRTDGNPPLVTQNRIPIRNMLLQYNYVFDRAGGLAQLNNYTWPQWVSSIKPPQGDALAKGTYRPLLARSTSSTGRSERSLVGVPSEVKMFRSDLPSEPGKAPSLFSSFSPYPDDSSGVSAPPAATASSPLLAQAARRR